MDLNTYDTFIYRIMIPAFTTLKQTLNLLDCIPGL